MAFAFGDTDEGSTNNDNNGSSSFMKGFLECPICYDTANQAVESRCCNKIFCEQCVKELQASNGDNTSCPLCRKSPITIIPSILARRMVDSLPINCPYKCGASLTRGRLQFHIKNCPNRIVECSASNCNFSGEIFEYLRHITQSHSDQVIRSFDFCNNNKNVVKSVTDKNNDDEKKDDNDIKIKKMRFDPVAARRNSRGFLARLGETGKYYCSRSLVTNCSCCNGNCGPTNGCNCYSCMELDIKYRMLPKGYLVNKKGFTARISAETGKFYCGRKVDKLRNKQDCDGYCGPTNGPNCSVCRKLDRYSKTKYKQFM